VDLIRNSGGHANIINTFDHSWLKGSSKVYYIDMELANLTLADYIYNEGNPLSLDAEAIQPLSPVFVDRKSCSLLKRAYNMWIIGLQIGLGLEFMHGLELVHRDLKPTNGMVSVSFSDNAQYSIVDRPIRGS
jgi:serine/threonine protein kinase